jgi:hypothetical protein
VTVTILPYLSIQVAPFGECHQKVERVYLSIQVMLFGDCHHLAEFVYTGWGFQVVFFISYLVIVACLIGLREHFLVFSFADVTGTESKLLNYSSLTPEFTNCLHLCYMIFTIRI